MSKKKDLNVGIVGYGFMGRAHSNAYRQVNRFFDLGIEPVLKAAVVLVVCVDLGVVASTDQHLDRIGVISGASIYPFRPEFLASVIFHQGGADGVRHTLIIDEIRVADDAADEQSSAPPAPQQVRAVGYDRHVLVRWDPVQSPALARYVIYRSLDGKAFEPVGIQLAGTERYADFLGKPLTHRPRTSSGRWPPRIGLSTLGALGPGQRLDARVQ